MNKIEAARGILADIDINLLVQTKEMISPFEPLKVEDKGPSYGLSSYGYDIRLGDEFKFLHPENLVAPRSPPPDKAYHHLVLKDKTSFILNPGEFVLARSVETFVIPDDVTGFIHDKSTYARFGIAVQNTVLEAGWRGDVTLEISNHGSCSVNLIIGAGIAQVLFIRGEPCNRNYDGKYQDQEGVTVAR